MIDRKRLRPLLIVAAIAAVALAAFLLFRDGSDPDSLTLYGNVEMRQVDVGFRVPGRLQAVPVEEGDRVAAGTILARLDAQPFQDALAQAQAETDVKSAELSKLQAGLRPAEIDKAKARLAELEATLRVARQTRTRQASLLKSGAVSKQSFDEATARAGEAEARAVAARKELALAREGFRREDIAAGQAQVRAGHAAIAAAGTALEDTILRAPSDVVILSRVREPGSIVRAGEPVLSLALERPMWVRAYVSEKDLGRIRPGAAAEVVTDSAPDKPYAAQVGFISPVAEFTPKSVETEDLRSDLVYQVRIVISRPDSGLRQGMPVTVRLRPAGGPKSGE